MRRAAILALALALPTVLLAADGAETADAMRRAVTAIDGGDARTARVEMQNALKADPENGAALALMAKILLALGDANGADAALERAAKAGVPAGDISAYLADVRVRRGDPDAAIAALDAAPPPVALSAYALRVRARAYAMKGDPAAAGALFDQAVELAPEDAETWIAIARFRMDAANQVGAVEAADRAIALRPGSADALVLKGVLVRNQYGLVAAQPWFERAIDADGQNVNALIEAASTLGDMGRAREMLAMTRRALMIDGGNPRAFYLQAVLAARARDYGLARGLIRRTGNALDDVPGAMLLNAVLEIQAGSHESAIARLDRLSQIQPDNLRVRRLLGIAQWRAGDYRAAADALGPIADRPDADAYTLTLFGRALEAMGERQAAAAYLDRAARPGRAQTGLFSSGDLGMAARDAAIEGSVPARIRFIRGLMAAGDGGRALNEAEALRRANPGVPAAHMLVGDVLSSLDRPADAAEAYRLAANTSFSEPVALRLIDALDRAGNGAAALETLRLFLAQNPRNVSALLLSADYLQRSGDWGGAIRVLEGLRARMGNRDAMILNNLAWAYARAGDPERGLVYARNAYALAPANPAAAYTYGQLLLRTGGDKRAAQQLIRKARIIAPGDPAFAS